MRTREQLDAELLKILCSQQIHISWLEEKSLEILRGQQTNILMRWLEHEEGYLKWLSLNYPEDWHQRMTKNLVAMIRSELFIRRGSQ